MARLILLLFSAAQLFFVRCVLWSHLTLVFAFSASPRSFFSQRLSQLGRSAAQLIAGTLSAGSLAAAAVPARAQTAANAKMIDPLALKARVNSGRAFYVDDFISQSTLKALQDDIAQAESLGVFEVSGLSNFASSQQKFEKGKDRLVAAVLGASGYTSKNLESIGRELSGLRRSLAGPLDRPSLADDSLEHEIYYSISGPGAGLPRHLDERHEELKGRKGYLKRSRRSLSWLLYLSDANWNSAEDGGQIRTFPVLSQHGIGGSHQGNLQVCWLSSDGEEPRPVFLDASRQPCALYILSSAGARRRDYISCDFDLQAATTSGTAEIFTSALTPEYRQRPLLLLEDREAWQRGELPAGSRVEEINPRGARLVIFDSVMLPHEVEAVSQQTGRGRRLALAGWWHELVEAV